MEKWPKRKGTRLQDFDYNTPGAYFLTVCVENRRCILSRIMENGNISGPTVKLLPYGEVAEKCICQLHDFYENISVESYVIMPNHVHMLLRLKEGDSVRKNASARQNSAISLFVSTFKRFTNKAYGQNIWQARSYDHVIRDETDFNKHLQYIYENPFKWQTDELFVPML